MNALTEHDRQQLFSAMKFAYRRVCGDVSCITPGTKYAVFSAAQKLLGRTNRRGSLICKLVRHAKRDVFSNILAASPGVRLMNDMFDAIDNISKTQSTSAQEEMAELKEAVDSVKELNNDLAGITEKSGAISANIDIILRYLDGELDDLSLLGKQNGNK